MNFSDRFKFWWWAILLTILTGISVWRLVINSHTGTDIFVFIFWFILVLFPIISEISVLGIGVKKDIEAAKNEIKGYVGEIKNQINFQPTINVSTDPADKKEYEQKTKDEIKENNKIEKEEVEKDKSRGSFTFSSDEKVKLTSENQRIKERLEKITAVEKLVEEILHREFGENYKSQIKITDNDSLKSTIVDGVVYGDVGNIREIVEIKFITKISFNNFYYQAINYLRKIKRFGLRIPVRFIIVSEEMDLQSAQVIKEEIQKVNYHRALGNGLPHTTLETFLFKDGVLSKVEAPLKTGATI